MRTAGSVIEGHILSLQNKKWEVGNRKWKVRILLLTSYFLLLTSALFFGCATTEDVGRLQWQINDLKSEVGKIKQRYQDIEVRLPKETERLSEKLKVVEEEQRAVGRAVSDLMMKVQGMSADVQGLIGRFEEARYSSEKNLKELTVRKDAITLKLKEVEIAVKDLKEKLARMEEQTLKRAVEESKKTEEPAREEPKKEEKPPKPDVRDIYMEAYKTYKAGKIKEAREKFMTVLKDYPENEYSDNARFWVAETYYKEKAYEDAILAYEELLRKNPESNKAPAALLKQGLAFYAIKEDEFGRITLEKLIKKFPNSEEAKLARKKLVESQTPKKKK